MSFFAALAVADAASSGTRTTAPWGIPRGGAKNSYAAKLDAVKETVLASTLPTVRFCVAIAIEQLRRALKTKSWMWKLKYLESTEDFIHHSRFVYLQSHKKLF